MLLKAKSIIRVSCACLALLAASSRQDTMAGDQERERGPASSGTGQSPPASTLTQPVMFNTPEADRILTAMQVFPVDNPWNEDISRRKIDPRSRNLIASVGPEKNLAYNLDMGFILVPPGQRKVPVKITEYPDESDPGPYPVPDNAPIEGWPMDGPPLETIQRMADGDRHMLVVDPAHLKLFEFYHAGRQPGVGPLPRHRFLTSSPRNYAPTAGPRPTPPVCRSFRPSFVLTS